MEHRQSGFSAAEFLKRFKLVRVQGENVVGGVSQLPFFVLWSTLRSCRSGLQSLGELRSLLMSSGRSCLGDRRYSRHPSEQEALKEPRNELRLPQLSPSAQVCQPSAGPTEFKGSLPLKQE